MLMLIHAKCEEQLAFVEGLESGEGQMKAKGRIPVVVLIGKAAILRSTGHNKIKESAVLTWS